ncbi:MFS transporter [Pseudonocardia kunmingensis]|uniref:ACS family D-galactonate transporter-like MFS transporter n=1 Tax=Pseudonocardia kunmingensis TaxID=630975 RepID=A0A543CXJ3_9PSEU|nr:MFS transporter [Pseudonocardia kunmingensis]TQM01823.1 ACS family D-galactonate transporter-like MFS transporter [Pseudonocardia kunmingensis]
MAVDHPVVPTDSSPGGGPLTEDARPTRVRWTLFVLLLGLVTLNYVDRGSISVAMPLIKEEFGLSSEATGLLLSAFFFAYASMQIPGGWLVDKLGPRKMATASTVGWGVATAASGLAWNFASLFTARAAIGVTEAAIMPAGGKLNATWMASHERGRGATILDAGAPLGAGIGGIVITALIAWTGSWRGAFVAAGIATALFGILAWRYIRDTPREHKAVNEAEAAFIEASHAEEDRVAAEVVSPGRTGLLPYLRFRSFWAMCLGWLGFNGVFYGLLTWGPLYLSEAKGFDLAEVGWGTFVIFGSGFVGELLGGYVADAWRARGGSANLVMRTLLGTSSAIVVAGLIGVIFVDNSVAAVALLSVVLFFLRWVGLFWSIPATLGGRKNAGILGGAMNLSGNVNGFVTPIVIGLIVGATGGYAWALAYFVGAGVVMAVSVVVLDYSRRLPV